MKFFTEEERSGALDKAIIELDKRAKFVEYKRGFNDCFAFLAYYDLCLRGRSRAWKAVIFDWKSTKEFQEKLYARGHTIKTYLEYCGYHIVKEQPILGDVAFLDGAMIYDGNFWVSTTETNRGVTELITTDPRRVHARPIRS